MITVSDDFVLAQDNPVNFPVTYVYYKRRYLDPGTSNYKYESSWTKIEQNETVSIESLTQNLDTETLGEFQFSSVQVSLKNTSNEWKKTNTSGNFAADATATSGYEPYWMKFKIATGFPNIGETDIREGSRSGGSEELITKFIGLATSWQYSSESEEVNIDIQGAESLLQNADASRVCNTSTAESIGTGDGETKEFYTANIGVGKVISVVVNSVTMTPGLDYEIEQLNDMYKPVRIIFSEPPTSAYTIVSTYEYWKTNELLEDLIEDLVDEAGITDKSISEPTLGSIDNNITVISKADFDDTTHAGTSADHEGLTVDFNSTEQMESIDLSSGDPTDKFLILFPAEDYSWSITGGELVGEEGVGGTDQGRALQAHKGTATFVYSSGFGSWVFRVKSAGVCALKVWFLSGSQTTLDTYNGYFLKIGTGATNLTFGKNEKDTTDEVSLGSTSNVVTSSYQEFKVTIDRNGYFKVYVDGTLALYGTDTEYTLGQRIILHAVSGDIVFDTVKYPEEGNVTYTSKAIDTKEDITAWGDLLLDYENLSVYITTSASSDGTSWDAYVALTGDAIQSAVKRYLKVKIRLTAYSCLYPIRGGALPPVYTLPLNERITDLPLIVSFTVEFTSPKIFVAMGNFFDTNCYDAIQQHAKFVPTYEWGLTSNEYFFFRERNDSTTVDMAFAQNINLAKILYLNYDYENMYSIVQVNYGEFTAEDSDTDIIKLLGRKIYNADTSVLINKNTNVASAIASLYLTRLKKYRLRGRILTKYYPQVELSDTISITFERDPYDTTLEPLLDTLVVNVIGVSHSPSEARSEFEFEEII